MFFAAAFLACLLTLGSGAHGFITIQGGEFVDESCNPFHFNGYNTWQILENAAGVVGSRTDVTDQFDAAVDNSFNVVRIFGFGCAGGFGLQTSPGQYNQEAWDALDFVINEAKKRSLRLVIALADNWDTDSNTDNRKFYVGGGNSDDFYTSADAQKAYQAHLTAVTSHVNALTKTALKDEETILSWNLINEPRCDSPGCWTDIQAWITSAASHLKSVDTNHLVTVGEDGFYDASQCNAGVNPAEWAGSVGQNFLPNHAVSGIDYASIHLWPNDWTQYNIDFARYWITNHTANAKTLQKPLVLEEFGKGINASVPEQNAFERMAFYKLIYSQVEESIEGGDTLKGILFWRWGEVKAIDLSTGGSTGLDNNANTVDTDSDVFTQVIKPFSGRVSTIKSTTVSGCSPAASVAGNSQVASASIGGAGSGPGPDEFVTPTAASCCSASCNAIGGRLTGTVVDTTTAASSDACCSECKGNSQCNVWNYCYCDGGCIGGTVAKGTCELRNQPNAFYPRADVNNAAGFLAGVPNVGNLTFPWECQVTGAGCTPQTVASCPATALRNSLTCPSGACNASQVNLGGDVITIDVNADAGSEPVNSAADCCSACRQQGSCNVWTFCPLPQGCDDGCQDYVKTAKAGTPNPPFGPNGGCDGTAFPYKACTLKNQEGGFSTAEIYATGPGQPWVSGQAA